MSMLLKLCVSAILACVCQTNLSQYIRIAGVAPDLLIVVLVVLTSYTGAYGGFCTGALTSMLYDASVGYVLAINMVSYTFIGWAAPMLRVFLNRKLKKLKHKSVLDDAHLFLFDADARSALYRISVPDRIRAEPDYAGPCAAVQRIQRPDDSARKISDIQSHALASADEEEAF